MKLMDAGISFTIRLHFLTLAFYLAPGAYYLHLPPPPHSCDVLRRTRRLVCLPAPRKTMVFAALGAQPVRRCLALAFV